MSATGFQGSIAVGNGEGEPFRFPPNTDFNFFSPFGAGSNGAAMQWGENNGNPLSHFDPLSQPFSGAHGQTSVIEELNTLTLQANPPDSLGAPPGQVNNHRSAPYAFTERELLPVNSDFAVNPAMSRQPVLPVSGAAPGNLQPGGQVFDHAEVIARLAAAEAKVQDFEHRLAACQKKETASVHLEPSILDELHKTCTDLIGCFEKVRLTDNPDEPPYYDLPEPLPADMPDRTGPHGIGTLFNPRWDENVTSAYNNQYITAVVDVMTTTKQNLLDPVKHTRDVLKAAAQEYLRSLKRARILRLDALGRERLLRRRQIARRWNRRRAKAFALRKASFVLRKVVGHAQSVGLDSLLDTDWVSSEHSDAAGNFEVRPVEWHSQKLRDLYASLRTIRAALPKGKTLVGVSPVASPQDDGLDFTDEQRIQFLSIVSANIELRKLRAAGQRKRFVGRSDTRMRNKAVAGGIISQDCVNEEWMDTYLSPEAAKAVKTPRPAQVTIWDAVLPPQLVNAKVRE